ncbi:beta-1,4-galactosyltransferase 1 [Paramisgurnus dabryanus]|uniref:beta-1,4-galactosyltransferase 1 n=1 Tax=Paramisgurnus dabryanus TaxID=90735 RepID=UPI0031F3C816
MLGYMGNKGFLTKACVVLTVIVGLHIILMVLYDSDSGANKYTKYRQISDFVTDMNMSVAHRKKVLKLIKYYSNGTLDVDLSELAFTNKHLEPCPETSPLLLGPLQVGFANPLNLSEVREDNPEVNTGGRYKPSECVALQKVAIIIPFRNRDEHLKYWLYYLHPILQRQQLDYGIYIIEQNGKDTFNRAKLLNVGYAEAIKEYDYDCFVFSDVDIVPMDDHNTYKCFSQPRHLSVSMDKFGFKLPYKNYFGGVSAMSKAQYLKINGFPNNYWGWGGEDDDIYYRLAYRGMTISRPSGNIGKCRMIRHKRDEKNEANPHRFKRIRLVRKMMNQDGIKSLKYKVLKVEKDQLFTKIIVDIGKPTKGI